MSDEERLNPIQWFRRGGWYFFVSLASLGILSPVPFLHAASRVRGLKTVLLLVEAVVFVAAVVAGLALPESQADLGVGLLLGAAGLGCVLQVPARRQAFPPREKPQLDPAVAKVLDARSRRAQARELVERDPKLARELHIGRPDRDGDYDDGGLVDLGSAPATVIADVCEIDEADAKSIVELRDGPRGLRVVDDVFTQTDTPVEAWERIRDHAVIVPDGEPV